MRAIYWLFEIFLIVRMRALKYKEVEASLTSTDIRCRSGFIQRVRFLLTDA